MSSTSASPTAPRLPDELPIQPLMRGIDFDIAVPGSKSITNRYLAMGALADGKVSLSGVLRSDDTYYMTEGLKALGFRVEPDWNAQTCHIWGEGGNIPAKGAEVFVGAAGTVMRFLSA